MELKRILTISDFPSGIPATALLKLERQGFPEDWRPTNMQQDLRTGNKWCVVWWYPQYVDYLFQVAHRGENHLNYLWKINYGCKFFFPKFFPETEEKLKKIRMQFKKNHLDEIVVKNGKVKV